MNQRGSPDHGLAIAEETRTAVTLIQHGLQALNRLDGANDFFFVPMTLLGQGFERLMKLILVLERLERTGTLPSKGEIRAYRHDISRLLDALCDLCEAGPYPTERDLRFMRQDPLLRKLARVTTDFAEGGRYFWLDRLLGQVHPASPDEAFAALEMEILRRDPDWGSKLEHGQVDYQRIYREMTVCLQRFARALCRLFTLGPLGQEGRRMTGLLAPFLFLRDEDLATPKPLAAAEP